MLRRTLLSGLAGATALGTTGWRVAQQKDTDLTAGSRVAGLQRDDSERARSTADYLRSGFAASIELDRSFGAVYQDPGDAKRAVLVFGGATLLWQPERELDTLFALMTDETGAGTRQPGAVRCPGNEPVTHAITPSKLKLRLTRPLTRLGSPPAYAARLAASRIALFHFRLRQPRSQGTQYEQRQQGRGPVGRDHDRKDGSPVPRLRTQKVTDGDQ